jgi:hypothetical protein
VPLSLPNGVRIIGGTPLDTDFSWSVNLLFSKKVVPAASPTSATPSESEEFARFDISSLSRISPTPGQRSWW